jgi:hypothetical protein
MELRKSKVAVLIKTCQGRPSLLWVLNSIEFALKDQVYRLYISDEKPIDQWKIPVYEKLQKEGHHIEVHNAGISCGVARNKLVFNLKDENLVLRLDDDFELGGEFNYSALETILKSSKEIGFCSDFERQLGDNKGVNSGVIRPAGGKILISPPKITKRFHSPFIKHRKVNDYKYSLAEFTRNLLLIKREVVEKVKWNEDLLFQGEHLEFMLSIRDAGYKGAYTSDSIHYHRDDLSVFRQERQQENRPGEKVMRKIFKDKWNCDEAITKYPLSWYFVEGFRRFSAKLGN